MLTVVALGVLVDTPVGPLLRSADPAENQTLRLALATVRSENVTLRSEIGNRITEDPPAPPAVRPPIAILPSPTAAPPWGIGASPIATPAPAPLSLQLHKSLGRAAGDPEPGLRQAGLLSLASRPALGERFISLLANEPSAAARALAEYQHWASTENHR